MPAPNGTTGLVTCTWDTTYTIPASALRTSGVYVARLRANYAGNVTLIDDQIADVLRAVEVPGRGGA